jgi:hypothetical protein
LVRVPNDGGGVVPAALPGLWSDSGEGVAIAGQNAHSKRFEDAVGLACESAAARRVALQFGLLANTVRAIDLRHLEGILNCCRTKVKLGVVEAVNGNIKALLRHGRGYRNLNYRLLKAQRLAATRTEFVVFQKAAQNAHFFSLLPRTRFC